MVLLLNAPLLGEIRRVSLDYIRDFMNTLIGKWFLALKEIKVD